MSVIPPAAIRSSLPNTGKCLIHLHFQNYSCVLTIFLFFRYYVLFNYTKESLVHKLNISDKVHSWKARVKIEEL